MKKEIKFPGVRLNGSTMKMKIQMKLKLSMTSKKRNFALIPSQRKGDGEIHHVDHKVVLIKSVLKY